MHVWTVLPVWIVAHLVLSNTHFGGFSASVTHKSPALGLCMFPHPAIKVLYGNFFSCHLHF